MLIGLFGIGVVISGMMVISSKKPVYAIVNLILVFINSVGIFITLGVDFIGILYLIVYIGAIAILFLFVVMMLNVKKLDWTSGGFNLSNYSLGFIIGIFYLLELISFLQITKKNDSNLYLNLSDIVAGGKSNIQILGEMLYKYCGFEYLYVMSLILLVAMIGAIILTMKEQEEAL